MSSVEGIREKLQEKEAFDDFICVLLFSSIGEGFLPKVHIWKYGSSVTTEPWPNLVITLWHSQHRGLLCMNWCPDSFIIISSSYLSSATILEWTSSILGLLPTMVHQLFFGPMFQVTVCVVASCMPSCGPALGLLTKWTSLPSTGLQFCLLQWGLHSVIVVV